MSRHAEKSVFPFFHENIFFFSKKFEQTVETGLKNATTGVKPRGCPEMAVFRLKKAIFSS
jgi:hypothetical protein